MPKSCSRIAGGVLVIATAGSAAAQINTLNELEAALLDCWEPPPNRAVAPGHADHRADELQTQRRAVRTAEDHISIGGPLGRGARVVSHGCGGDAQALRVFALHGGARKRLGRCATHHALRR
jgi:hypothetical protein